MFNEYNSLHLHQTETIIFLKCFLTKFIFMFVMQDAKVTSLLQISPQFGLHSDFVCVWLFEKSLYNEGGLFYMYVVPLHTPCHLVLPKLSLNELSQHISQSCQTRPPNPPTEPKCKSRLGWTSLIACQTVFFQSRPTQNTRLAG